MKILYLKYLKINQQIFFRIKSKEETTLLKYKIVKLFILTLYNQSSVFQWGGWYVFAEKIILRLFVNFVIPCTLYMSYCHIHIIQNAGVLKKAGRSLLFRKAC